MCEKYKNHERTQQAVLLREGITEGVSISDASRIKNVRAQDASKHLVYVDQIKLGHFQ